MNEDRIYDYIRRNTDGARLRQRVAEKALSGVTAVGVAAAFSMQRANVSALLNQLVKKGRLAKIVSRPVYFLPVEILRGHIAEIPIPALYTPESFFTAMTASLPGAASNTPREDPFALLLGVDSSLAVQTEQAKSAIRYPPHGLHTLLIGESGVGKTLFAGTMHEYGMVSLKKSKKDYPYVRFNCADYYHTPQLLMSHLFGHVKGAFTGAVEETKGLVEKADGGILFLDEIHRLPPEGQELLFYLMDKGHYRKLGESGAPRKAEVLILAATTEAPEDVLLKTFIRRIPLTISLPPFRAKPLEERIRLIEHGFMRESTATRRTMVLNADVVKALACFDFPGNIRQLASEIKVLCARTFLNADPGQDSLHIDVEYLPEHIRENYRAFRQKGDLFPESYNAAVRITPSSDIQYIHSGLFREKGYKNLMKSIEECLNLGYGKEETNAALSGQIQEYCNSVLEDFYLEKINKDEIYKVVDPKIADFTIDVTQEAFRQLDFAISQRAVMIMAFHIKALLERLQSSKAVSENEISRAEKEYGKEIRAAEGIVSRIRRHFGVVIPRDEKYLLAILLANIGTDRRRRTHPALIVMAHGTSTASSIATVSNQLMDCDFVKAIDVPLNQEVWRSYQALLDEVRAVNPEKGVILAVDMGSLTHFGERLTRDTGIPARTIPNVTTLTVIELTRLMLGKEDDIDAIYAAWVAQGQAAPPPVKQDAILTVCASGLGTSEAFRSMLQKELEESGLSGVRIMALNFTEVQNASDKYRVIRENYNVLACVGNMECSLDVPFFHITRLINPEDKRRFITFVDGLRRNSSAAGGESLHNKCKRFLEQNATYINPESAVRAALRFLRALDNPKVNASEALQISLALHLGFMLERNICGKKVRYENHAAYIEENRTLFASLKAYMPILEDCFDVTINDPEICYIMQTINKS